MEIFQNLNIQEKIPLYPDRKINAYAKQLVKQIFLPLQMVGFKIFVIGPLTFSVNS
jgi:hypothetical protein